LHLTGNELKWIGLFFARDVMPIRHESLSASPPLDPRDPNEILMADEGEGINDDNGVDFARMPFEPGQAVKAHLGEIDAFARSYARIKREVKESGSSPEIDERLFKLRMSFYIFILGLVDEASENSGIILKEGAKYRDRIKNVIFSDETSIKAHPAGAYWEEAVSYLDERVDPILAKEGAAA
jgi:hypothetical protein